MCALAARPGETVPAAELATQADVPPPYLAKIMQQLAATNFVSGRRGIGGSGGGDGCWPDPQAEDEHGA